MTNEQLTQKVMDLEKRLAVFERAITVFPTKIVVSKSMLVNGLFNADRVYTKRTGDHVELTT